MLEEYKKHVAERAKLNIPPLPLSADQTSELVNLLKNDHEEADYLLNLFKERIPAGVDQAAYVKAAFLTDITTGKTESPHITKVDAVKVLGTMLGGYNIQPLINCLKDEELADEASKVLSKTLLIFDAFNEIFELSKENSHAQKVIEEWANGSWFTEKEDIKEQIKLINDCAPEHLILLDNNFSSYIPEVSNAGSIFCGPLTPVSFGDYASGTNHVLPTNGMAKTRSGLGLIDFGKVISFQYANQEGFNSLAPVVTNMANLEGLTAHAETVAVRKKQSQLTIRESFVIRRSKETEIFINVNLDGNGLYSISTGINFLDHMLEQLSKHSGINLSVKCIGDTHIDEHHTIEDVAISLGSSINEALGDRKNINRYSSNFSVVMDECQSDCLIDLSSRSYLKYQTSKLREFVGDLPTEMVEHFFKSLVENAKFTCHLKTKGENTHHIVESSFKSFAKAFGEAIKLNSSGSSSTKGFL